MIQFSSEGKLMYHETYSQELRNAANEKEMLIATAKFLTALGYEIQAKIIETNLNTIKNNELACSTA